MLWLGLAELSPALGHSPPSGGAAASGESPSSSPRALLMLELLAGRGAALVSPPWFFITTFVPAQPQPTLEREKQQRGLILRSSSLEGFRSHPPGLGRSLFLADTATAAPR